MNPGNDKEVIASIGEVQSHPYLLDTSALFTFIEDEHGADRVEQALNQVTTLIPWTVLLETYYITLQEEGQAEADRRIALIKQLKVRILWDMDESILLTAAKLKANHRISLAEVHVLCDLDGFYSRRMGFVMCRIIYRITHWFDDERLFLRRMKTFLAARLASPASPFAPSGALDAACVRDAVIRDAESETADSRHYAGPGLPE